MIEFLGLLSKLLQEEISVAGLIVIIFFLLSGMLVVYRVFIKPIQIRNDDLHNLNKELNKLILESQQKNIEVMTTMKTILDERLPR